MFKFLPANNIQHEQCSFFGYKIENVSIFTPRSKKLNSLLLFDLFKSEVACACFIYYEDYLNFEVTFPTPRTF